MKKICLFICISICQLSAESQKNKLKLLPGFDALEVSTKTMQETQEAFNILKNAPIVLDTKKKIANNCENRAEFGYKVLEKMGFKPINFWILKESLVEKTYKTKTGVEKPYKTSGEVADGDGFQYNTKMGRNPTIGWVYHVAAGVIINNNGKNDTLIFDPWTQGNLKSLREWGLSFFGTDTARTAYAFAVTGLYTYFATDNIGQLKTDQASWQENHDTTSYQMYCGLCGITPNEKCTKKKDKKRFKEELNAKEQEIIQYLKGKNILF